MSLPSTIQDRDFRNFKDNGSDTTTRYVSVSDSALPSGAATEVTLASILAAVNELEGFTDGLEGLLTALGANTDGLESFVDGLEGLLTTIRDNADTVEALLTNIRDQRQGTLTNISGTATTSSAQIAAANATRKYFFIMNVSAGVIWINFGTAAVAGQPSIRLQAGDTFVMEDGFISTEAIHVIAASGSRDFTAKEAS